MAQVRGGVASVLDYWNSVRQPCSSGAGVCPDTAYSPAGTNNIDPASVSGSVSVGGKKMSVMWTRPLAAGDPTLDFAISNQNTRILLAIRSYVNDPTQQITHHDIKNTNADMLNFFSSPAQCPQNCNGRGTCVKGCCQCMPGFSGASAVMSVGGAALKTSRAA
jgi:hypothetical protein